jgi:hypothetical protein
MVLGDASLSYLDNQMLVTSGPSMVANLIAELRKASRSDFVIGVTRNALLSDQEDCLESGVDKCMLPHRCDSTASVREGLEIAC